MIEGYWDDDFGRARNESLGHCTGEWALHIDADEIFEGNARIFRSTLEPLTHTPFKWKFSTSVVMSAILLPTVRHEFSSARFITGLDAFTNSLMMRDGSPRQDFGIVAGARLIHHGYTPEFMEKKGKAERNIRIAQIDADTNEDRDKVDTPHNPRSFIHSCRSLRRGAWRVYAGACHDNRISRCTAHPLSSWRASRFQIGQFQDAS